MEMQQLRYVVAVARTGNFSRAAEQCHVAQPSLSQQIQKLEEHLGERLFDRLKRVAKLTPYGATFLPRAKRILQEAEAAEHEAAEAKGLLRGTINLGVLPTIAPYLLPAVMVAFAAAYPGLEIIVQEDTTARLLQNLAALEIDFALASQPVADPRLTVQPLFQEALLLALPPGHPLAQKEQITLADLKEEGLIVMKDGHCLGDQVLDFCERRDWRPPISFRSAQLETVQALVRAGLGISLVPAMAAKAAREPGLTYRPLTAPAPAREIVAVWSNQRPPGRAANELLKVITGRFGERREVGGSVQTSNSKLQEKFKPQGSTPAIGRAIA